MASTSGKVRADGLSTQSRLMGQDMGSGTCRALTGGSGSMRGDDVMRTKKGSGEWDDRQSRNQFEGTRFLREDSCRAINERLRPVKANEEG